VCLFSAIRSYAQTVETILNFNGINGASPPIVLVQGTDGNFYGMTGTGGTYSAGTVFKVTPDGTLTTLYSFCPQIGCTDGASTPLVVGGGLVQGTDGKFYGTTPLGGTAGTICNAGNQTCGTVFKITSAGALTTLHSFSGTDGSLPNQLIQATDGNFYGTAQQGGANSAGTVFKITPAGALTTLYSFCAQANCTDGGGPIGALVQAGDGNFYGTTFTGGTVFKITPTGKLTTLATVGGNPSGTLVQGTDGNFYGTTSHGGTIFKITPTGKVTTLASDCCYLYAGLVQATDGNFYGTTYNGGSNGAGSVFEITPGGTLTTLYSFCPQTGCTDGELSLAGLIQGTDGNLYGTTVAGGTAGTGCTAYDLTCGTIFRLGVGLGPFVETRPTSGKVGARVKILGTNLTGASSVTFNGTPAASFTVNSTGSTISTVVPNGATTGKVQVTTPSGTLSSNVKFRVTPVTSSFSPITGPVGTVVTITGQALTGATAVTFGGVKAISFTVNSYTQVTATVATGAKTGKVAVSTPGGTAVSAGTFTVQ
jgi:uncharacterized repeat protein (TIGR03803 family)